MIHRLILITFFSILTICITSSCTNPQTIHSTDGTMQNESISESNEIDDNDEKPVSEMTEEELLNSKRFKAKMRELAPIYAKQKVQFKMLCSKWSRCKSNREKRQFINKHKDEVGMDFDVDISTIAKAENLFVTHPDKFMEVMELKLKARAARELAEESYQRSYELRYSE